MIKYCASVSHTKRWKTREVMIGNVGVGGDHPIRIQSMATSSTRDVEATVDQVIRLADAGCEIVRVTVQGMKEVESCELIKNKLLQKGYTIPLVADIHFFPPAALGVIDFVDKVRINPGNYVDKRASFKTIEYDDLSYLQELDKIEEKFTPLVEKCKKLKKAMRIGTNHGSLSDRILNRYGDTPKGMLESALEFARICRKNDFHDLIFSMKSSNPQVMILAYRLLVAEMIALGWDYPVHLGVTEAGEGEDGRIKSAMGIGSLLLDGIGDTIRISLTEDPWNEIDPCKRLLSFVDYYRKQKSIDFDERHRWIDSIQRRPVIFPKTIPFHRDGTVFLKTSSKALEAADFYKTIGCDVVLNEPKITRSTVDGIVLTDTMRNFASKKVLKQLQSIGIGVFSEDVNAEEILVVPLQRALDLHREYQHQERFSSFPSKKGALGLVIEEGSEAEWEGIQTVQPDLIFLSPLTNRLHFSRHFFDWLQEKKLQIPVILAFDYQGSIQDVIIQASAECGALLCDGLGDGVCIQAPCSSDFLCRLSFNILQAARRRTFKTDFISCPSCGRTLFDLQDVSKRIRLRTSHLPGVKIAIMGCIVNGPGEMADADFGYVGSKPGKIDLYIGKKCVEKNIDFSEADDRLIALIQQEGRWIEPEISSKEV